jgi:hypothetical protein
MNVVGGYVVTGRMLKMFRRRPAAPAAGPAGGEPAALARAGPAGTASANGQSA